MPPKKASSTSVWVVTSAPDRESDGVVYAVHASETDASDAARFAHPGASVFKYELVKTAKPATKTRKDSKSPSVVAENDEDDDMEDDAEEDPKAAKKAAAAEKKAAADAAKAEKAAKVKEKKDARSTIPEGVPGAFDGLNMLFTGTFQLDRKTCIAAAEKYGATIKTKISECDYVVLGTKAGPKKLVEIEKDSIETITEAEFLEWLAEGGLAKSEPPAKKQKI